MKTPTGRNYLRFVWQVEHAGQTRGGPRIDVLRVDGMTAKHRCQRDNAPTRERIRNHKPTRVID